jgi:hypothetical protein
MRFKTLAMLAATGLCLSSLALAGTINSSTGSNSNKTLADDMPMTTQPAQTPPPPAPSGGTDVNGPNGGSNPMDNTPNGGMSTTPDNSLPSSSDDTNGATGTDNGMDTSTGDDDY